MRTRCWSRLTNEMIVRLYAVDRFDTAEMMVFLLNIELVSDFAMMSVNTCANVVVWKKKLFFHKKKSE